MLLPLGRGGRTGRLWLEAESHILLSMLLHELISSPDEIDEVDSMGARGAGIDEVPGVGASVACARGTASQPGQSVIWAQAHAWATRPLNVTSCTCICAESQEVTWSPPHAQLPGETSSVDSVQASSVELLTSVADDAGGGGHGGGAGGEVAQVAAVLPSWMASQIVSQMVSQRGGDVSQRGGDVSLRGGEDRLPGRWWYGILTTKSGSENNLGSTCPIRVIRSVTCRCPGQLAGCWQSVIRSLLYWSIPCSQTREASCPTGYASQSEISAGVPDGDVLTLERMDLRSTGSCVRQEQNRELLGRHRSY